MHRRPSCAGLRRILCPSAKYDRNDIDSGKNTGWSFEKWYWSRDRNGHVADENRRTSQGTFDDLCFLSLMWQAKLVRLTDMHIFFLDFETYSMD